MSTPKPFSKLTEVKDTAEIIGSFLKAPDLGSLCQTSKDVRMIFSKSKQLMQYELLKAVFDADPKQVKEILAKSKLLKTKCMILVKGDFKETYFSRTTGKTYCKRVWTNISPLEAAAWCGDIFLVRELLLHIPTNQKSDAGKQLQGILDRKESEENGSFLAPYKALIKAYQIHNEKYNEGSFIYDQDKANAVRWQNRAKLRNEIWQKQRLLPTYGLQEYCSGDRFFHNLPSFDKEPIRMCLDWNLAPLDLNGLTFGGALSKGSGTGAYATDCQCGWSNCVGCQGFRKWDREAIENLVKVRVKDLMKIILEIEGSVLTVEEAEVYGFSF